MKNSQLAFLTLAIGLVGGTAFGFWLRGSRHEAAEPNGAPGLASPAASPGGASAEEAPTFAETRDASRSPDASEVIHRQAKRITQRVAASHGLANVDVPAWTGEITGWVLDEDGHPIAGAVVSTFNTERRQDRTLRLRSTDDVGRSFRKPKSFEEAVDSMEETVAQWLERDVADTSHLRTAESDATGSFRLTGLRDGAHLVSAHAEGFMIQPEPAKVGESVEFTGKPVQVLELDVRLPDGTQPTEAAIAVASHRRPTFYAWSPESPTLRLPGPVFDLQAYAGEVKSLGLSDAVAAFESDKISIDLDRGNDGPRVITLHPARLLRVHVNDTSTTQPRLQVWVKVIPDGDELIDWTSERVRVLINEGPGQFLLKGLDEGAYVVGVGRGDSREVEIQRTVRMGAGTETVQVTLGEPDMSSLIVVRCISPSGRPVKDVRFTYRYVALQDGEAQRASSGTVSAQPGTAGTHWVNGGKIFSRRSPGSQERVTLIATSERFGTIEAPIDMRTRELTMPFEPACALTLTATGAGQEPYVIGICAVRESHGAIAEWAKPTRKFTDDHRKPLDRDGRAVFRKLQPGTYEVLLERDGADFLGMRHRLALVTLRAPVEEVTVAIPPLHTVEVFAPRMAPGSELRLIQEGASLEDPYLAKRSEVDSEERCVFENIPAGRYTLWARHHRGCEVAVQVPSGRITFETKSPNALRVRTLRAGGPAALAGFQLGDVITHINGQAPTGPTAPAMTSARIATAQVTLTIRRGTATLDLPMGPVGETDSGAPNTGFVLRSYYLPD